MSNLNLKSICEILGENFFVPSYQRGYRWTVQQVKDLLDDIQEFIEQNRDCIDVNNDDDKPIYCIQPLVVKKKKNDENDASEKWEVIDGQQRLTTIYIILAYLKQENIWKIKYETRSDSEKFLSEIMSDGEKYDKYIDYYYMYQAKCTIENWFKSKTEEEKNKFLNTLLKNVQFIWYESDDENPINVFTRLNIGKIPLTNSELIKALFLNKSNFEGNANEIRKKQQEIAMEWDKIEYTLQNDEFWYFINEKENNVPTRIDFIFDLICKLDLFIKDNKISEKIGTDEYKTFRYFYLIFKNGFEEPKNKVEIIDKSWKIIKNVFQTFEEWYNDLELYHYIGFLISNNYKLNNIVEKWNNEFNTKESFINKFIIEEIKKVIKNCNNLDKIYETDGNPKTQCKPLLLLYNIQTIINQNQTLKKSEKYKLPIFYKFPFHLYKKEKWDIEHIDPVTENTLEDKNDQIEWLLSSYIGIDDENLKKIIKTYLDKIKTIDVSNNNDNESNINFIELKDKIQPLSDNALQDDEKNMIWNFALLDSSTNRGYGNAIFAAKRRFILGKDQGKKIIIDDNLKIKEQDDEIAFVPPCTKNVFLKYYSPLPNNLREWNKIDAENYKKNIKEVLSKFLN